MSNPKYKTGEIVRAYNSLGDLMYPSTMIVSAEWAEERAFYNATTGLFRKDTGWFYLVDLSGDRYFAEPQLKRIPPPARQTWEELRKSLSLEAA